MIMFQRLFTGTNIQHFTVNFLIKTSSSLWEAGSCSSSWWAGATRLAAARRSASPANTLPVERLQSSCFNLSLYLWLQRGSAETLSSDWRGVNSVPGRYPTPENQSSTDPSSAVRRCFPQHPAPPLHIDTQRILCSMKTR